MRQIDLRKGAKRQQRALALFAVIQCWLKADMKEFFPYQKPVWKTYPQSHFRRSMSQGSPCHPFLLT
jgi:hypothetical protein